MNQLFLVGRPLYGYYPMVLAKGPGRISGPFSRTRVYEFFWVPKIDPTIMAPISMIHWDPMGMGMCHMYELEAYVYVYWHDAYILCHLGNFSQVK